MSSSRASADSESLISARGERREAAPAAQRAERQGGAGAGQREALVGRASGMEGFRVRVCMWTVDIQAGMLAWIRYDTAGYPALGEGGREGGQGRGHLPAGAASTVRLKDCVRVNIHDIDHANQRPWLAGCATTRWRRAATRLLLSRWGGCMTLLQLGLHARESNTGREGGGGGAVRISVLEFIRFFQSLHSESASSIRSVTEQLDSQQL